MRRCISKFSDVGSLSVTALALSHDGRQLASGSNSGMVNIYDGSKLNSFARHSNNIRQPRSFADGEKFNTDQARIQRDRTLKQLVTSVETLKFNHDDQILAMTSSQKKDQGGFKLIHATSGTAFSNWPTAKTPLGYVHTVDFSPRGGMLAVGGDKGSVLLMQIKAFSNVFLPNTT